MTDTDFAATVLIAPQGVTDPSRAWTIDLALLDEPDELTAAEIVTECAADFGVSEGSIAAFAVEIDAGGSTLTLDLDQVEPLTEDGAVIPAADVLARIGEIDRIRTKD